MIDKPKKNSFWKITSLDDQKYKLFKRKYNERKKDKYLVIV